VTGSSRFSETGERLPRPPESDTEQVADALYIAARNGRRAVAEWLLDHGADPNFRGYLGATALHWAEFSGDAALAALLRQRGADETLVDHSFRCRPVPFATVVQAAWGFHERLIARLTANPGLALDRGERGSVIEEVLREPASEASLRGARILEAVAAQLASEGGHPAEEPKA